MLLPSGLSLIGSAVQNGIRHNCLTEPYRPFTVSICIGNDLTKHRSIHRHEFLIKSLHLHLPFTLCYKRFGADNQNIFQFISCLQFFNDQTGFNRLTYANAVSNQYSWLISVDQLQCRPELVRDKIDPG